jgi:transposase
MTAAAFLLLPYGRLLSPAEAQQHLGISASTIRTWHQRRATSGLYSAGLLGRAPLFYEADLIAAKRGLRIRDDQGERIHTLDDLREVDETQIR